MLQRATLVAITLGCLLGGCGDRGREQQSPEAMADFRRAAGQYDSVGGQFLQSLRLIGKPLKGLTEEQHASVAALLLVTRVVTEQQLTQQLAGGTLLESFWTDLPEVCPPLRSITLTRGGCLDEDIAYVSALARCHDEGKSEDECEREAAPEAAAAVTCHMRQIEALAGIIRNIQGKRWPPGPFPWPIQP